MNGEGLNEDTNTYFYDLLQECSAAKVEMMK
jgi:hypothetical protein